jgi:type IX secretion system PorP/SprF family membrane protein
MCKYKTIVQLLFLSCFLGASAQDIYFSQLNINKQTINPALTASDLSDKQLLKTGIQYKRIQNIQSSTDQTISSALAEFRINNKWNFGQYIFNHTSGNLYSDTRFFLSASYRIANDIKHELSMGLQAGILQKKWNMNNFTFDSQYSPSSETGFNNQLSSGENFVNINSTLADVNTGFFYKNKSMAKIHPYIGAGFFHLTQPNESITNAFIKMPVLLTLNTGFNAIMKTFIIAPQFTHFYQAKTTSTNTAFFFVFKSNDTLKFIPHLGLAYRSNSAIIIHAGAQYKNWQFNFSYDIYTNKLDNMMSNSVEFSLMYTFNKKADISNNSTIPIVPLNVEPPFPIINNLPKNE